MSADIVTIAPTSGDTARKPGETLELSASWSLATAPSSVVIRLLWFAEGFEVSEGAVVASKTLPEAVHGEQHVTFTLPKAPYSFVGTAIKLRWAVELIAGPANTARWEFNLSPSGQAIVLGTGAPVDDETPKDDALFEAVNKNDGFFAVAALLLAKQSRKEPVKSKSVVRRMVSVAATIGFLIYGSRILGLFDSGSAPPVMPAKPARPAAAAHVAPVAPVAPAGVPTPELPLSARFDWVVSERGFGPIIFDRSAEANEAAIGSYFKVGKDPHGCSTTQFPNGPDGAEPIIDGDQVVGVRVQSGRVETSQHVKIGTYTRVVMIEYQSLGYSIVSTPADSGYHELIVTRPGPGTYQIIFGIFNDRVLSYRAGNTEEMVHRQKCSA